MHFWKPIEKKTAIEFAYPTHAQTLRNKADMKHNQWF